MQTRSSSLTALVVIQDSNRHLLVANSKVPAITINISICQQCSMPVRLIFRKKIVMTAQLNVLNVCFMIQQICLRQYAHHVLLATNSKMISASKASLLMLQTANLMNTRIYHMSYQLQAANHVQLAVAVVITAKNAITVMITITTTISSVWKIVARVGSMLFSQKMR